MKYKYRIVKERDYSSFKIERKSLHWFSYWKFVTFKSDIGRAREYCKNAINKPKELKRIIIEEFEPCQQNAKVVPK